MTFSIPSLTKVSLAIAMLVGLLFTASEAQAQLGFRSGFRCHRPCFQSHCRPCPRICVQPRFCQPRCHYQPRRCQPHCYSSPMNCGCATVTRHIPYPVLPHPRWYRTETDCEVQCEDDFAGCDYCVDLCKAHCPPSGGPSNLHACVVNRAGQVTMHTLREGPFLVDYMHNPPTNCNTSYHYSYRCYYPFRIRCLW